MFAKIVTEFALEYKTTRDKVLQLREKKANQRERKKTRGKMIVEVLPSLTSCRHTVLFMYRTSLVSLLYHALDFVRMARYVLGTAACCSRGRTDDCRFVVSRYSRN